jgi:hypothetical protein
VTSLVRQIGVAFWGEQQAVVGTRRDGLYFWFEGRKSLFVRYLICPAIAKGFWTDSRQTASARDATEKPPQADYQGRF